MNFSPFPVTRAGPSFPSPSVGNMPSTTWSNRGSLTSRNGSDDFPSLPTQPPPVQREGSQDSIDIYSNGKKIKKGKKQVLMHFG